MANGQIAYFGERVKALEYFERKYKIAILFKI